MRQIFFRILLLIGGVGYLGVLSVHSVGAWLLDHPTAENLQRGIRWNSSNPSLWAAYARFQLDPFEDSTAPPAAEAYLKAATLNPFDPATWDGLVSAYLQMGEPAKAEATLRAALVAIPRSPYFAWRFANFLVQQGRAEEALPYLRTAAAYQRSFRAPVFDISWKLLADPERILRDVVPSETAVQADYLMFLLRTRRFAEAYPVWSRIRADRYASFISLGNTYAERLAGAGMGQEAARVWDEILKDTDKSNLKPPGTLLTNGDFEYDLIGAGLGWRLSRDSGYLVSLDEFESQQGTRSLRVTFDGSANPDFAGVRQWVPVTPNRRYRFAGYLKTENISSDSGLRFSVSSAASPPEERFTYLTENRVGTMPWVQEQVDFKTGPNTQVILITLRRIPSRKLNNLLQGKVWMDHLSLTMQPQ